MPDVNCMWAILQEAWARCYVDKTKDIVQYLKRVHDFVESLPQAKKIVTQWNVVMPKGTVGHIVGKETWAWDAFETSFATFWPVSRESIKLDERIRSQNFCRLAGSASCVQTGACPDLNHSKCPWLWIHCSFLLRLIVLSHAVYLQIYIFYLVVVKLDVTSYRQGVVSVHTYYA